MQATTLRIWTATSARKIRAAFLPNFLANIDIEAPAANQGRAKETLYACPAAEISPSSPPETCPSIR
jgi:hypothetical protein